MTAPYFRRDNCRLCGGRDLEVVLQMAPTPVADAYVPAQCLDQPQATYPLDLALCLGCGHLQLPDVVDPDVLFRDYTYVSSVSLGLVEHFRRYSHEVLDRMGPADGALVVEIGSNDGSMLRFFKERGMRVLGVDPALNIAQRATESGIETLPTFFTSRLVHKIKDERGPAAILVANNVFAHSDDLADMADGVRELLAPDGVFVFEVSYLVDVIQKSLFDTIFHEHLCYHSVKPLDAFFRGHGMELIDVQRVPSKGGSLRGTAQLAGGPRAVSPSVAELIAYEVSLGMDCPDTFRAAAARLEGVRAHLGSLISDLNAQRKTIAGYGASAGVTTLLYYFNLGDVLSFLVDDNPSRQKLFSPGYHIPVLPPQAIYERKPDYVVILAWTYSEPIMRKHQAFLDQGGHFIVPLPEIQVI